MASKKPANGAAKKKTDTKKAVTKADQAESAPAGKAAKPKPAKPKPAAPKAAKQKSPEMQAAVRVTKKNVKAVMPASKTVASLPEPAVLPPENHAVADVVEPVTNASPPQYARQISHDDIRHLAYLKWEAAGRPEGDGGHFWWEAERELTQQK